MALPIPNLDDKTFDELFEEARALIPRYAPEWTDHNLSDPGITLVDLFAWLTEMQIYSLNRVTDKNVLKFLRLLGTAPQPATSAQAEVSFSLKGVRQSPPDPAPLTVPRGTAVAAIEKITGEEIVFETEEELSVTAIELARVLTYENKQWLDQTDANQRDGVFYFAFGNPATQDHMLYLGFDSAAAHFPAAAIKLTANIFDADLPPLAAEENSSVVPSAEWQWEYWNGAFWRALDVEDHTARLAHSGRIIFYGPEDITSATFETIANRPIPFGEDTPLYWMRARVTKAGHEIPPRLDTILVNTIAVSQGQTFFDEKFSSTGLPGQSFKLNRAPVLPESVVLQVRESDGDWHTWHAVSDFDASGPEAHHFIIDLAAGVISFGDGIHGRVPPAANDSQGPNLRVERYRAGGGEMGNVQALTINRVLDSRLAVNVSNRQMASGGKNAETLVEAKARARRDLKTVSRGVTSRDYEKLALATPGIRVARVQVLPLFHPQFATIAMPGAVTLVVVPDILPDSTNRTPQPSEGFRKTVRQHLEQKRLATTDLHVIPPQYIKVSVQAKVRVGARMRREEVKREILEALRHFLDPLQGGPEKKGWPFGREVFKSEIYQVIENINGVLGVEKLSLSAKGCFKAYKDKLWIPKIGLVYSGEHDLTLVT